MANKRVRLTKYRALLKEQMQDFEPYASLDYVGQLRPSYIWDEKRVCVFPTLMDQQLKRAGQHTFRRQINVLFLKGWRVFEVFKTDIKDGIVKAWVEKALQQEPFPVLLENERMPRAKIKDEKLKVASVEAFYKQLQLYGLPEPRKDKLVVGVDDLGDEVVLNGVSCYWPEWKVACRFCGYTFGKNNIMYNGGSNWARKMVNIAQLYGWRVFDFYGRDVTSGFAVHCIRVVASNS